MAFLPLRNFPLEDITDLPTRQSLQWIRDYLNDIQLLQGGFQLIELEFTSDVTQRKIPHHLGFVPADVWISRTLGAGVTVLIFNLFTSTDLVITTQGTSPSDPLRVRLIVGRIEQGGR